MDRPLFYAAVAIAVLAGCQIRPTSDFRERCERAGLAWTVQGCLSPACRIETP